MKASSRELADKKLRRAVWRVLATFSAALLLDILTKRLAEQTLTKYEPVPVAGDVLRLALAYNRGIAFGFFATGVLTVLIAGRRRDQSGPGGR